MNGSIAKYPTIMQASIRATIKRGRRYAASPPRTRAFAVTSINTPHTTAIQPSIRNSRAATSPAATRSSTANSTGATA